MAKRIQGFTLVEALVALLVLSIGLLGVAGLQLTALKNNNSASFRSQATYLAYDITDRMRANRARAVSGLYDVNLGVMPAGGTLADSDVTSWKTILATTLPAGDGSIVVTPSAGGVEGIVTITIQWDDTKGVGDPLQFVTRTRI